MQIASKDTKKKPLKKGRIVEYLEKHSDSSEVKAYAAEWQVGIVIFWVLTGISQLISMISGYGWFYNHVLALVGSHTTAVILSLVLVIIIEFVANYLCFKAVKFCLKMKTEWATAIPVTLLALVFYCFSFYNSTQGAALWASEAADNTSKLNENYSLEVSRLVRVADEDERDIRSMITAEKANPQGWKSGKRNGIITEEQLNKIQKYNDQIFSIRQQLKEKVAQLKQEKQEKLEANDDEVNEKSKSYFAAMSALLILQLICNFFLQFSSERIRVTKEETDTITLEKLKTIKKNAVTNFVKSVVNEASEHLRIVSDMEATDIDIDEVQSGLNVPNTQPQATTVAISENQGNTPNIEQPKSDPVEQLIEDVSEVIDVIDKQEISIPLNDKPIESKELKTEELAEEYRETGFNASWRNGRQAETSHENQPQPAIPVLKNQGILVKHSKVVEAIQQIVPVGQTTGISNEQCTRVAELLKAWDYPYSSRSLIQNVDRSRKSHQII